MLLIKKILYKNYIYFHLSCHYGEWGLGIGDWGLGIGDWAQSPIPNPQSPIPIISAFTFHAQFDINKNIMINEDTLQLISNKSEYDSELPILDQSSTKKDIVGHAGRK